MEQIVPREKWLYNDRGMMKWMGWLLSDHSAFMEGEKVKERLTPVKPEMEVEIISEQLKDAWENSKSVSVQINVLENDEYVPEIEGVVVGFDTGRIYLQLDSGETRLLHLEEIRCVNIQKNDKWWTDGYAL
ncbi:hypothetical protein [Companilactobacillus ginsenosidimutans]|uniref:Uncharacterized protein n=1 Tax=Companilactobacillus ginsenosidimutans TaxID=1007676 RepID=A0A0H4QJG3_9LACO|nr:hypothetical protein [Companilactobacillus ginsenosidimutans]AKP66813.1 hypothetical protein ABM34_04010 [Companilactobacillus ginsenosidimutans]